MNEDKNRVYLERIIESIQRIERFISNTSEADFSKNELVNDAVLMQLINIGEMANQLNHEIEDKYSDLPLHEIIGMRNQIAHGYFEIRPDVIWRTCQTDLPELKDQIRSIIG